MDEETEALRHGLTSQNQAGKARMQTCSSGLPADDGSGWQLALATMSQRGSALSQGGLFLGGGGRHSHRRLWTGEPPASHFLQLRQCCSPELFSSFSQAGWGFFVERLTYLCGGMAVSAPWGKIRSTAQITVWGLRVSAGLEKIPCRLIPFRLIQKVTSLGQFYLLLLSFVHQLWQIYSYLHQWVGSGRSLHLKQSLTAREFSFTFGISM